MHSYAARNFGQFLETRGLFFNIKIQCLSWFLLQSEREKKKELLCNEDVLVVLCPLAPGSTCPHAFRCWQLGFAMSPGRPVVAPSR